MSTTESMIERAFERLLQRPGFISRPDQKQLSLLLGDLIANKSNGAFEAPTGLGKSLAALVPAIAHSMVKGRRVVIATYTNVLAEQYWRSDLPLALSLFEDEDLPLPKTAMLMGRSRYACLVAADEHAPETVDVLRGRAKLGIESEFRQLIHRSQQTANSLWSKIASPPVCPARLCPAYDDCFYYRARRDAERAGIVITNHSVVISDAIVARSSDGEQSLLGDYDFLILDEAHDFPQAATSGLEFELSKPQINALIAVAGRVESALLPLAQQCGQGAEWSRFYAAFKDGIARCETELAGYGMTLGRPGIITASPPEVLEHPHVKSYQTSDDSSAVRRIAFDVSEACDQFVKVAEQRLEAWKEVDPDRAKTLSESTRNYGVFLREYGSGCHRLFDPDGVAVSYVGRLGNDTWLRQDVIDLAEPLQELIWNRVPYACLSATLAVDGQFEFFRRVTGAEPEFEEILPSPFDHATQTAIYLPKAGAIADPTVARRNGDEPGYYRQIARELTDIITAMGGRTLALFHSRKEMEGVAALMQLPPSLPILMQTRFGGATVGEQFKDEPSSSLFALRSFWTGFDAPGETLSCVALVRIPFEVPVDPPSVARVAYLQTQDRDPFREHTLPNAKMMMRQGAGRLIRRATDHGVIALLDARIRTKNYGEEFLANFPDGVSTFDDIFEAMAHAGISSSLPLSSG
jgi:ATP-dependent DNA helicase DinG